MEGSEGRKAVGEAIHKLFAIPMNDFGIFVFFITLRKFLLHTFLHSQQHRTKYQRVSQASKVYDSQ